MCVSSEFRGVACVCVLGGVVGWVSWGGPRLHVLELVDATLRVALANLAQRLVLVATLAHILAMDLVVDRLLGLVARLRQVLLQGLRMVQFLGWNVV